MSITSSHTARARVTRLCVVQSWLFKEITTHCSKDFNLADFEDYHDAKRHTKEAGDEAKLVANAKQAQVKKKADEFKHERGYAREGKRR